MVGRIYRFLRDFIVQMGRQNISSFAASTAFFFFLSIVPCLIMLCTILPYTPLTEANLLKVVTDFLPNKIEPVVVGLIGQIYEKSAGILSIAVLATIWSAGKGLLALMRGLNAIDGVEEERNYFIVRGISSLYTLIMLLMVLISLCIMVFGDKLVEVLLYKLPLLQNIMFLIMNFRFLLIWIILMFLFALIYAFVPNKKQKIKDQFPGAIFASVAWSVFSWGFSIYIEFWDYSIYGSLAIIIIAMLWLYFCMYIVLIGAYINERFQQQSLQEIKLT